MTIIRTAAFAALLFSTGGTIVALAQPAGSLLENPPESLRLLCRPVTVRQAGAAVRLWRCPPRVTSALSPAAPRGVSNADADSVYAANENWSQGEGARPSNTARGEARGSAGGTRTADGSPETGITGRGFSADGGTSSGGVGPGGGSGAGGGTTTSAGGGAGGGPTGGDGPSGGGKGGGGGGGGPGPGNPGNDNGVGNAGEKHGDPGAGKGDRGASDTGGHGNDGSRGNGGGGEGHGGGHHR